MRAVSKSGMRGEMIKTEVKTTFESVCVCVCSLGITILEGTFLVKHYCGNRKMSPLGKRVILKFGFS